MAAEKQTSTQASPDTTCISPDTLPKTNQNLLKQNSPDLVTCGECLATFPLDNILDFISHKRIHVIQHQMLESNKKLDIESRVHEDTKSRIPMESLENIEFELNETPNKRGETLKRKRNLRKSMELGAKSDQKKKKRKSDESGT